MSYGGYNQGYAQGGYQQGGYQQQQQPQQQQQQQQPQHQQQQQQPQHHQQAGYGGYGRGQAPAGGAGGFAAPPPGAPPNADPQLWQWFTSVDRDQSGSISAPELQQALVNGDWTPFDLDTVKLLMSIFDTDRSGTITFNEYTGLWRYIKDWQNVFRHFDTDRSGSIDGRELANALTQFGYQLSPQLLQLLERKYDVKASAPATGYGPPPGVTFDRFVRCCVVVKQLTESFQKMDQGRSGVIQLSYDQFMQVVLSAP